MNRNTICLFGMLIYAAECVATSNAQAQQLLMPRVGGYNQVEIAPTSNPVVSPYLLLANPGQSNFYNYQTLVQPLLQQRMVTNQQNAAINRLGQQMQQAQQAPKRNGQSGRDTGHETRYLNYSHYYSSAAPR